MKPQRLASALSLTLGVVGTLTLLWLLGRPGTITVNAAPDAHSASRRGIGEQSGIPRARTADATPIHYIAITGTDSGDCSTPAGACRTIQYAVDQAGAGDEIRVAAGSYSDVSVRPRRDVKSTGVVTQVAYISKALTLRGGYTTTNWTTPDPIANVSILDAQGQGRVLYITGQISASVEGLRITGGYGTGLPDNLAAADCGGGVFVITATATISENWIYGNTHANGAGLCLHHSNSRLNGNIIANNTTVGGGGGGLCAYVSDTTLRGNTFLTNHADLRGGGLYSFAGPANLEGNSFRNNTAVSEGGGGYIWGTTATLTGNEVLSNTAEVGGGLYTAFNNHVISGNTIANNVAVSGGGGVLFLTSSGTLVNNVVAQNRSSINGSGICLAASSHRFVHNTIADNAGDGGGIYLTYGWWTPSSAVLTNTIVSGHAVGISAAAGNSATLESTLWYGNNTNWEGTVFHNQDYFGDPTFKDPGAGDYHIGLGSAAIDRGMSAGTYIDIDGELRPFGSGYDLGADEFPADINVTKYAEPNPVSPGAELTYTIIITNTGKVGLHTVITDKLPNHILPGETPDGKLIVPGGLVTWTAAIPGPGGVWAQQFAVTAELDYTGTLVNVVTADTEEGVSGIYTRTVGVGEAITGLAADNDSPTQLGNETNLWASVETGNNVSYEWSFGDGASGTGSDVSHTYPEVGIFTAVVTASNNVSLLSATTSVTITDVPIAGLNATNDSPTQLGSVTTLTAAVVNGSNVIYTWAFGDGQTGLGSDVTHTYSDIGVFTALVTAANPVSALTATTEATITDVPITGLTASNDGPTPLGQPTKLTASVTEGSNVIYVWAFGDGAKGSGAVVTHEYPVVADYTAAVTASNSVGTATGATSIKIRSIVFLPLIVKRWPPLPYPTTLNPIDNEDGDAFYVVSWNPAQEAQSYSLEEDDSSAFSNPRVVFTGTDVYWSVPAPGKTAGTYHYRVRGQNAWGYGTYSNIETVSVLPPVIPSLIQIENPNGYNSFSVKWSAADRATSYTLQESSDTDFNNAITVYEGDHTSWSALGKMPGTYYYRVLANGPTGRSGWSNVRSTLVTQVDLIINGGFETGPPAPPWIQYSNAGEMIRHLGARTGSWGVYMGGAENAIDQIYQELTIPAAAPSPQLAYWRLIRTSDSIYTPYDYMRCVIWNTNGNVLASCGTFTNVDQSKNWIHQTYNMAAFRGQTVRVAFQAFNDNLFDTQFFVDDVSLLINSIMLTSGSEPNLVATEKQWHQGDSLDAASSSASPRLSYKLEPRP